MRKKVLVPVAICILLLLFILLFPDSSKDKNETTSPETYELVMQFLCNGENPVGLKDVQDAVNEITEEKIGVTLCLKPTKTPVFDANLTVSAGEKLDLSVSLYGSIVNLINEGYLLPLDELLETNGKRLRDLCGMRLSGGTYQGNIYGIPTVYSEGKRYGFICRTDLMKKYGFSLEEGKYYTFDELEQFFKQVKDGEGDDFYILGGSMAKGGIIERSAYMYDMLGTNISSGVLMLDQDINTVDIVNFFETREFEEFAERMYKWQKLGFFMPNTAISGDDVNILMKEDKILGWFFHNAPGEEDENASTSGKDVTFIPTKEAVRTTNTYQDVLWSVPITCENPQKVMEFLELLYTDREVMNLLQRGIEGSSYVVVQENENGKLIALPEGETVDTVPYYTNLGIFGNRLEAYTWVPGDINRNKTIQEFSDSISLTSPAWGYVFDTKQYTVQISEITDVINKYIGIIETGAVNPKIELPMFLSELSETKIDKVIAENQRQFDQWRSREK